MTGLFGPIPGGVEPYDLICIGCGPAGEKAATQAACFGHRVAIVEREASPGGAMVNTGTIASKALRETALLCSAFRRRPLPGWECSVDHNLSLAKLMAQRYRVQYQEHDRIERSLQQAGIQVHRGHGRIVGPDTVSVEALDGTTTTLKTKFILIATGSSPLRPEHIPFSHSTVVDADDVLDLTRIPDTLLVAGGGAIGCEYACMFAEIGVSVTLAEAQAAVLPFIDSECRDHLLRAMGDAGIDVRLNTSIEEVIVDEGESVCARSDDGEEIRCDVLLWTAGRCSNTYDLGLDELRVARGTRGLVKVNDKYQTNVPSIYAAGDVIGFPALASTSMEQGRIAACHMFGIDFKTKLAATVPFGLYTIPAVSTVGLTEQQATEAGRDVVVGRALYRCNVRGRMIGDEQGIMKCVFDRPTRQLVGATIVGEVAAELIHLAQFVISNKQGIDDFIDGCFNYPSLSELYKYAAYDALQAIASGAPHQAKVA
ncbi:MAG: Si-specific NAD(P)(+) transhydrogenase [Planctomycetota bacterium]